VEAFVQREEFWRVIKWAGGRGCLINFLSAPALWLSDIEIHISKQTLRLWMLTGSAFAETSLFAHSPGTASHYSANGKIVISKKERRKKGCNLLWKLKSFTSCFWVWHKNHILLKYRFSWNQITITRHDFVNIIKKAKAHYVENQLKKL